MFRRSSALRPFPRAAVLGALLCAGALAGCGGPEAMCPPPAGSAIDGAQAWECGCVAVVPASASASLTLEVITANVRAQPDNCAYGPAGGSGSSAGPQTQSLRAVGVGEPTPVPTERPFHARYVLKDGPVDGCGSTAKRSAPLCNLVFFAVEYE